MEDDTGYRLMGSDEEDQEKGIQGDKSRKSNKSKPKKKAQKAKSKESDQEKKNNNLTFEFNGKAFNLDSLSDKEITAIKFIVGLLFIHPPGKIFMGGNKFQKLFTERQRKIFDRSTIILLIVMFFIIELLISSSHSSMKGFLKFVTLVFLLIHLALLNDSVMLRTFQSKLIKK